MEQLQSLYKPKDPEGSFEFVNECLHPTHSGAVNCEIPMCLACQAAKAKRRSTGAVHKKQDPVRRDVLSANTLKPGQQVHVDQYESSVRGRLPHTRGRESIGMQYCGGTIFFDAASGLIKVYHQSSLAATDTLISKQQFEQEASQCGISIESYHADNGIFTATKWTESLKQASQGQTLSGVGGHHQNVLAK
jgi:hypothetical protein